jgi:hypothetical protein
MRVAKREPLPLQKPSKVSSAILAGAPVSDDLFRDT